jgi:aspartate dehydrogenase
MAARLFPKNANLAATVSLAGIGFDRTMIKLIADPAATGNTGVIEAVGAAGTLAVEAAGPAMSDNPKTSESTAYSMLHAIDNRSATLVI